MIARGPQIWAEEARAARRRRSIISCAVVLGSLGGGGWSRGEVPGGGGCCQLPARPGRAGGTAGAAHTGRDGETALQGHPPVLWGRDFCLRNGAAGDGGFWVRAQQCRMRAGAHMRERVMLSSVRDSMIVTALG